MTQTIELKGTIERIIYRASDSSFAVAVLYPDDDDGDPVTIVGPMYNLTEGLRCIVQGTWQTHSRYGVQLKVEGFAPLEPDTAESIEAYLAGGLIKGIGPVKARAIVEKFVTRTFEVMDAEPEHLKEVPGIGDKNLETIMASWQRHREAARQLARIMELGISYTLAVRILEEFEGEALNIITTEPYRLTEVRGVGFATADRLARDVVGIPFDDPERIKAGVMHTLSESTSAGHVCRERAFGLVIEAAALLGVLDGEQVQTAVDALVKAERVCIERDAMIGGRAPVEAVYLRWLHGAEKRVAERLRAMVEADDPVDIELDDVVSDVSLSDEQLAAVRTALKSRVLVLTGGPGTGKTTVLKTIVYALNDAELEVRLCAPTGKAARRMTEVIGGEYLAASTIHRLLGAVGLTEFEFNADNPLSADVLIVDEVSMLDLSLADALFAALKPTARIILVGDDGQLPSVGAGNVLGDILASGVVPTARLTRIFRQAAQSAIVTNARRIRDGKPMRFRARGETPQDFFFVSAATQAEAVRKIVSLVAEYIPDRLGYTPEDVQVLSLFRSNGDASVEALNRALQARLNPSMPGVEEYVGGRRLAHARSKVFRVGDVVMQVRNDYERAVFNGEMGKITGIAKNDDDELEIAVSFDDSVCHYSTAEAIKSLDLAYAMTVHKSQGSQFPVVVIPVFTAQYMLLKDRRVMYTGITRAEQVVILVGQEEALDMLRWKQDTAVRYSGLAWRLRGDTQIPMYAVELQKYGAGQTCR